MGGFMGIGQSRTEKTGERQLGNIFNWSMPEAQKGQTSGQGALGEAQKYFSGLMTAGRTQTAANAAPAVQAATAQADTAKRQEATLGTARSGGTAAASREATGTASKNVDDIIAQTMLGGKQAGAEGLASTGEAQLKAALAALGIGGQSAQTAFEVGTGKQQDLAKSWISALI